MSPAPEVIAPLPRWRAWLLRMRRPVLVVAGIGTVVGGLAGYLNMYRAVRASGSASGAVSESAGQPAPADRQQQPAAEQPISILVLPFANQTGDPAKAYVADGLTTAITGDLSRISGAIVVPPVAAVGLQDKKLTLAQLGLEARVRFVLQGGVVASGEKVRINAQLSDTQSGVQLWSQTFEGSLTDLFALQDDVTLRIRGSVGPQMILTAARDSERRAQSPQVADLLLRADAIGLQQQSANNWKAVEQLSRQALALEPGNLRAMALLADSLSLAVANFDVELALDQAAMQRSYQQAAELARKVLAVNPNQVQMLNLLAWDARIRGDLAARQQFLESALAADPNNVTTLHSLGGLYLDLGDADKARSYTVKAMNVPQYQVDALVFVYLARAAMQQGKADDALAWARKANDANPGLVWAQVELALAYGLKGDATQARKWAGEVLQHNPTFALGLGQPWPGKAQAYRSFIDKTLLPAAKQAGLPVWRGQQG